MQAVKALLDAGDKPNYRVFPGCVKNNNSPSGMGNHITDFASRCSQHSAAVPADSRATRFGPKPAVGNASVPVSEEKARDWAVDMVLQELLPIHVVESIGGKRWLKKHSPGMCGKTKLTKVTDEVIQDPDSFYTDATSCAMDAFNLGIGQPVLDRHIINSPFDPDKGVSYEMMMPAIKAAGFEMDRLTLGSKKKRTNPTMTQVLGLVSGVFFVEFFWKNKSGESDFHVVTVNCDQRRVFCNTLGVIPFAAGEKHESAATHAQVADDLKVVNVYRVYRIVQRV